MALDSDRHRRSIRLRDYDYAQAGAYFVTICAYGQECLFGEVAGGQMQQNYCGQIVFACWNTLPNHFANIELDAFVVMPNHFHGILVFVDCTDHADAADVDDTVGANNSRTTPCPLNQPDNANYSPSYLPHGTIPSSLGAIVQTFKATSTRKINQIRSTPGYHVWQR